MPTTDLNTATCSLVADEVAAALDPFMNVLERMSSLLGTSPVHRGPGRPPKTALKEAGPIARRRYHRSRGSRAKAAVRAAKKLSEGQNVHYRQGKGTFEAKVVSIDAATGKVELERVGDGKKVLRPAIKVMAAA